MTTEAIEKRSEALAYRRPEPVDKLKAQFKAALLKLAKERKQ